MDQTVLTSVSQRIFALKQELEETIESNNYSRNLPSSVVTLDDVELSASAALVQNQVLTDISIKNRKQALETAIEKIKQGIYGKCSQCRRDIETERFEKVLPVFFCKRCQAEKEKNSQGIPKQRKTFVVKGPR